ncbi:hypothetical protein RSOLAG1IB_10578 [Rhizoctonia solani AG-1 IB]|uniref:CHAT domain-containing protein n=1 Tax=Thanatephorus cucumeris (strain AG1-IB / isolate 7/3/14) TaxID=1108050 RepID=A0A0B7G1E5_THACB|nr:hypothetical protein RSOLAG1IB_10578 [Rhizoctonia solani AG-1 IB]
MDPVPQEPSEIVTSASETKMNSTAAVPSDINKLANEDGPQLTAGDLSNIQAKQIESKSESWKASLTEKWSELVGTMRSGGLNELEKIRGQMESIVTQAEEYDASAENNRPSAIEALVKLDQTLQQVIPYTGHPEFISLGIRCCTRALSLVPPDDNQAIGLLNNLGNMHWMRFQQSGTPNDLDIALDRYTRAKALLPRNFPNLNRILLNIGNCYLNRFQYYQESGNLDQAIECYGEALALTPNGEPDRGGLLNALATALHERFQLRGEAKDLEDAIEHQEECTRSASQQNFDIPGWLGNLGSLHQTRFEYLGKIEDIDKSIHCIEEAISITPREHPNMASLLNNLGDSLRMRYDRSANVDDINKAVETHLQAVAETPVGHSHLPDRLITLGSSFATRYDRLAEDGDLQNALESHRKAMLLSPKGQPGRPKHLMAIGMLHIREFEFHGKIGDIDSAIGYFHEALPLLPKGHPAILDLFDSMAIAFYKRFNRLDKREDLDKSIELYEQAMTLATISHTSLPRILMNLGNSYQKRFETRGRSEDIDKAVDCHVRAIDILPTGHPNKPGLVNNLALSYLARASFSENQEDIAKAFTSLSEANELATVENGMKPIVLHSLATAYYRRHDFNGDPKDIESAIEHYSRSMLLIPNEHAVMPGVLYNLARCYQRLYRVERSQFMQEKCIEYYRKSAQHLIGDVSIRLRSALIWARLTTASSRPIEEQLNAYTTAMGLVSQLMIPVTAIEERYDKVREIGDLALGAAAVAISAEKYQNALEWLEQGRLIVWNHTVQLKDPLNELSLVAPTLSNRLQELSRQLHEASFWKPLAARNTGVSNDLEIIAQRHRRAAEERIRLIEQVRQLPGFEKFLGGHKYSELVNAAVGGPVVVINADQFRCDALVLLPNHKNIAHIPLPNLTYHQIDRARDRLMDSLRHRGIRARGIRTHPRHQPEHVDGFAEILTALWHNLTKPILDGLGYMPKPNAVNLPHIIWCPTGALSFLPLHATGDYSHSAARLSDYAVSSYTPTLSALLDHAPESSVSVKPRLLIVGQAQTLGQAPLPGTREEIESIKTYVQSPEHYSLLEGDDATPDAVLTSMQMYDWVHLACHAHQHASNPTSSGFLLHNGTLSIFTIAQRNFKNKGLAFLSACQTARGDERLPDEAAHLASAMLMAGYKNVIATMWSIMDVDAPLVADGVYARLLTSGDKDTVRIDAARALHDSVKELREKIGEQNFSRWIPYIHIGQ